MGDQKPLVSIVIPCYNGEAFLQEAVESALAQTYSPIEIFVVNDGSTDGSLEIAACFGDRIRILSQPNLGLSAARNTGIIASKGEYILLLDIDDRLLPTCIETRFLKSLSSKAQLICGAFREMDAEGNLLDRVPSSRELDPAEMPFYQVARHNLPIVGGLIHRDVFQRVGYFDPLLKSCEDLDFLMRAALRFRIAFDPTPGIWYRMRLGSLSTEVFQMYSSGRCVLFKNAVFAPSKLKYRFCLMAGSMRLAEYILYRFTFQKSFIACLPVLLRAYLKFPSLVPYTLLAVVRYLLNRLSRSVRAE